MLGETKVFRCVQNCVIVRDGSRTESGNELYTSLFAQKEQHKKTNNKKAATNNKALTQL